MTYNPFFLSPETGPERHVHHEVVSDRVSKMDIAVWRLDVAGEALRLDMTEPSQVPAPEKVVPQAEVPADPVREMMTSEIISSAATSLSPREAALQLVEAAHMHQTDANNVLQDAHNFSLKQG